MFDTRDSKDAEKIVERVLPRLQHVNSAVVLSAVKVRGFRGEGWHCWPASVAGAALPGVQLGAVPEPMLAWLRVLHIHGRLALGALLMAACLPLGTCFPGHRSS